MKVGNIVEPNSKGQVVIPKKIREALGITPATPLNVVLRGGGVYLYPVREVVSFIESENSYLEVLKKTQGAWKGETWEKTRKARKKIELKASLGRKKAWS